MGEDCREMAGLIEAEADRLTELVNNILDMSRLEAGAMPLDLEECHLLEVVEASLREFRHNPDHATRRVDVLVPADLPPIMADYDQLRRVVVNLLTNAAKFSDPTREIRVRARAQEGGSAVIEVQDHGVGIPPDEQQAVFEKFYRGRQQPGTYRKGSGLGLAICKAIVEAHSGSIAVESALGKGSVFRVTLPGEPLPLPSPGS